LPARVEDRDVGLVDRQRLVDHATGGALHRVRLDVLLDHVHAFDEEAIVVHALRHGAALALSRPVNTMTWSPLRILFMACPCNAVLRELPEPAKRSS
jgi:hypothetical protein